MRYAVDAQDRLQHLDPDWLATAEAGGAPWLTPERVRGRSLWEFISDPATRHIYQVLFERVRAGTPLGVPFRCDTPSARRRFRCTLTPGPDGGIGIETVCLDTQSRDPVPLVGAADLDGPLIQMCSWCKQIERPGGGWLDLQAAVEALGLLVDHPPRISHGACPACLASLDDLLEPDAEVPMPLG